MERNDLLILAQKIARLPRLEQDWRDVPDDMQVVYRGGNYYPVGYQITFKSNGEPIHSAILQSCKARQSLVYAPLSEVSMKHG